MKRLLAFIYFIIVTCTAIAQQATVEIEIPKATIKQVTFRIPTLSLRSDLFKKSRTVVPLQDGRGKYEVLLTQPTFITLQFSYGDKNERWTTYNLYLSPGDQLKITPIISKDRLGFTVNGKGSANNQEMMALHHDFNQEKFTGDTLPDRIIAALNERHKLQKDLLKKYIMEYEPTAGFIRDWTKQIDYEIVNIYHSFKENTKFGKTSVPYYRNYDRWKAVQDSLLKDTPLNSTSALVAPSYTQLLSFFMLREKERIWREISITPEQTLKNWYDTDTAAARLQFYSDRQNDLQERIINKYFTGAPADYLYAVLLESAVRESNPKNVVAIYNRYKSKYPQSTYMPWFATEMARIEANEQKQLTDKMVFAKGDGKTLKTFEEVLALVKGKTVLLDMWGTWCGPCREEIEKNGAEIKKHFKDKGMEYLYVSNYDEQNYKEWKNLIAYFNLEGLHILANKTLTDDIMKKSGGQGFPTYIVIKKDGTFELSKAGYPMDRQVLIRQLTDAL